MNFTFLSLSLSLSLCLSLLYKMLDHCFCPRRRTVFRTSRLATSRHFPEG